MASADVAVRERNFFDAHEEFDWLSEDSIRDVLQRIPPVQGDVLELCAGSGMFTRLMPRDKARYVCLDLSETLLTRLKTDLPDIEVVVDSAIAPELPDASFDYVCVFAGLHHLPDLARTAENVHRLLRRGGRFVCFEPNERCWYRKPMRPNLVRDRIGIWSEDEGFVDPDVVEAHMRALGFANIRTQYLTVRYLDTFLDSLLNRALARIIYCAGAVSKSRQWQAFFVMEAQKAA